MDEGESYEIVIGKDSYALKGMKKIVDEQILSNPKDIDITFEDLLTINEQIQKNAQNYPTKANTFSNGT